MEQGDDEEDDAEDDGNQITEKNKVKKLPQELDEDGQIDEDAQYHRQ